MNKACPDVSEIELDDTNQNNGKTEETVANVDDAKVEAEDTKAATTRRDGIHLEHLCKEISDFAASLCRVDKSEPLETPKYLDEFLDTIESKLDYYESLESSSSPALFGEDSSLFLKAIQHLALLIDSVSKFKSVSNSAAILLNLATSQLHRAMLILGDDLALLLHKRDALHSSNSNPNPNPDDTKDHQESPQTQLPHPSLQDEQQPQQQQQESGSNQQQEEEEEEEEGSFPGFLSEDISLMSSVTKTMVLAGYRGECSRLLLTMRICAFEEEMESEGFEKLSIDEAQRMQWETLEAQIGTWIRVSKRCTSYLFPGEVKFYQAILDDDKTWMVLYNEIASSVLHQLVNLAHAVAMTQRSYEKLFKFLDMHETLRDLGLWLDQSSSTLTEDCIQELRSELGAASGLLGQAAVSIFCDLKASISILHNSSSSSSSSSCVGGSIHPITTNTINYLNSACKYKDTLEELFLRHLNTSNNSDDDSDRDCDCEDQTRPFTAQLRIVLDLLDANLEAKSTMYKDPSLRYIFLMNNVSYMLQEIKGSKEMHHSLGNTWCRKGSTDLRSYHKNYQRDTWTKVLQCLTQDGLLVNGKVDKPVLKDRFKNFNLLFDDIHKTQRLWVVSDEQLQSELRVSISAVIIPAYRAFYARFGPIFTPGRQYEKHIKYQPEDIEAAIEDLFDGTCS